MISNEDFIGACKKYLQPYINPRVSENFCTMVCCWIRYAANELELKDVTIADADMYKPDKNGEWKEIGPHVFMMIDGKIVDFTLSQFHYPDPAMKAFPFITDVTPEIEKYYRGIQESDANWEYEAHHIDPRFSKMEAMIDELLS